MTAIQLDLNKLLGFKIIASEVGRKPEQVILGAKVGNKNGSKTGSTEIRIGAKIGQKEGFKIR